VGGDFYADVLAEGDAAGKEVAELASVDFVGDGDLESVAGVLLDGEEDSVGVVFGRWAGEGDIGGKGDGLDLAAADASSDVLGEELEEAFGVAGEARDFEGLAGDLALGIHGEGEGGELAVTTEDEAGIGHGGVEELGGAALVEGLLDDGKGIVGAEEAAHCFGLSMV
jgi:hypothetical protein